MQEAAVAHIYLGRFDLPLGKIFMPGLQLPYDQ